MSYRAISVNTDTYRAHHGGKAPRGKGFWMLTIISPLGRETRIYNAAFSEAVKMAKDHIRSIIGRSFSVTIVVEP